MKNKITVIHHSADFDGLFCREIAKKFLGTEGVDYIGWDFGDLALLDRLPGDGPVYILDLPVDRTLFGTTFPNVGGTMLAGILARVIWIDHHKSSIETHPKDIPGYRIDGVAACRLAYQWFYWLNTEEPRLGLPKKEDYIARELEEPYAVQLAGEYDIWDKRNLDAETFQFGLRSVTLTETYWEHLLSVEQHPQAGETYSQLTCRSLLCNGAMLQRYQQEQDKSIVERLTFLVEFEGLKFLALNSPRFNSLTFAAKDVPETGHDALMGFRWDGQAWTVSLYHAKHRTDLDLSAIAAKFGGGGHRGACGFRAPWLNFLPDPAGMSPKKTFEQEIRETINRHSMENGSNTPDFILACFLLDTLQAFNKAVRHRAYWYGHETQPVPAPSPEDRVPPADQTYEQLEVALAAGKTVEMCTINQFCQAVAWTKVETINRQFPASRYRIVN